jgi:hypothetical protein
VALSFFLAAMLAPATLEARSWTDLKGTAVEAEYVSSTADSVVLRRTDGQALRLRLADLSIADREFVAGKQKEEKEAQMIAAVIAGDIVWRLPAWNSLSWSSTHDSEIWLWDEKTKAPTEQLATVKVTYSNQQRNRNQFDGRFKTSEPVRLPKTARVVVKAKFSLTVNGEQKQLEKLSVPMPLPALKNGTLDLPAVRLTITR